MTRGHTTLVVQHVPVETCPVCERQDYAADVDSQVETWLKAALATGEATVVRSYSDNPND